jgi:CO/xanthine dehydrogenase Mo-binding subunit
MRAFGLAENAVLAEGALAEAGIDRSALVRDPRVEKVLLDTASYAGEDTSPAVAGARVVLTDTGAIERVEIRVAAGDPLDEIVLRSYCIGAAHMALGWVCSEGLAVDPDTGDILDLTIRSFGVIRPARTPPIDVTIVDDPFPPQPRASDAVFAAVAAATWNAITAYEGARPEIWPARETAAARALRR